MQKEKITSIVSEDKPELDMPKHNSTQKLGSAP